MEGDFGKCLSSPLFTFTVGADQKKITVHSSALAGLSGSLDALLNGEMIEAKTRHVDWSEVDVDIFVRLCEFAYFRNYTPPSPGLFDDRLHLVAPSESAPEEPEGAPAPCEPEPEPETPTAEEAIPNDPEIPYREQSVWTGQLRDAFASSLIIPAPQIHDPGRTFIPPVNYGSWEDFTPVFLDQARLYVLADKYCISSLCHLVLSKMHHTLRAFKLYDNGVNDIIEFVRFVYLNTPPDYGGRIDALRNLATRYVVSVLGQIGENEEFQKLLQDGGPFVSDFWHIIWGVEGEKTA